MRWRQAISTSMSIIPARCGPTSFTAPTSSRAQELLAELKADAGEAEHHAARRTRLRKRLCAGDAAQARRGSSASARSPISPRMPGPCRSPATTNSSRGRNGPALRKAYGLKFRAQRQMQPDFMYAAVASGEVDVIAGYTSDGLIAQIRSGGAGRSQARDPALRRDRAAGAEARRRCRRCAAALAPLLGRIDIASHARGQSARRRRRRRIVAGCGGALAVGEDREVTKS